MKAKIRIYQPYGQYGYCVSVEYRNKVLYHWIGHKSEKDTMIGKAAIFAYNGGFTSVEYIES